MRQRGTGERYFGVYLATIADVDDPDGLGRVRLETDQYADTDDDPTWAAVARPLAGSVFTVFFTPKVGDQVVFAFLAGDVRQPIVMGYAHATDKKPADGAVGTTKHAIAVDGVGSITFDESGGGKITIAHAGGGTIELTSNHVAIEAGNVCVNDQGVVLAPFLVVYDSHTHPASPSVTSAPNQLSTTAVPTAKTSC